LRRYLKGGYLRVIGIKVRSGRYYCLGEVKKGPRISYATRNHEININSTSLSLATRGSLKGG
jgi:hypothetical protein